MTANKPVSKWVIALVAIIITSAIGVVVAATTLGLINIRYRITQPPALMPSTINLDLGDIPSGSTGDISFGKVATLNLTASYKITFTLDPATLRDFDGFEVWVDLYEHGGTKAIYSFYIRKDTIGYEDSKVVNAGAYEVHIRVKYTAAVVSAERMGNIRISVSYSSA